MPKNIIAVIGATGAQGGGLVRAILADANSAFAVRAITRDSGSQGARSLAEAGAEIVAGDLDDRKSIRAAFEGAYGAYCVTFFGAHFSPEKELQHANDMAEAANLPMSSEAMPGSFLSPIGIVKTSAPFSSRWGPEPA